MTLTYIDANVLINAFRGTEPLGSRAMQVLDDPNRIFVVSNYLKLEVLAKPTFHKQELEIEFMNEVFDEAREVSTSDSLTTQAITLAATYDMTPLDALHASAALIAKVDEFVTAERDTKPIFKVGGLKVTSIHS
jgi:hypothetical protein